MTWEPYFLKQGTKYDAPPEGRPLIPLGAEPHFWSFAERARKLGIDMSGNVTLVPSTTLYHILLEWAHEQQPQLQNHLSGLLFEAYYSKDIFLDVEALASLAGQAGYDASAARAHLISGKGESSTRQKAHAAMAAGVNGIPSITINGKISLSGAKDAATFKTALRQAAQGGR